MTNPSPLSLREDQIDKLCQWQECAFKHFDEADKDSMREWTRDFLNQAIALSREATPLTAPVASEPTWAKLDIMEAISYCYKTLGHAQGTKGCIAFARGAEWAMDKLRAAPQTPSPVAERMYEFIKHGDAAHCEWLRLACIAFCNGEERPPAIPQTPSPVADETEMRADGQTVRKDRWEFGIRRIVALLWGNRHEFEVDEVVEAVRKLVPQPFNEGNDEGLVQAVLGGGLARAAVGAAPNPEAPHD